MAISFNQFPSGSIVGSGSYVFRHYGSEGRLPSEYQEVEWIGSSGTQYIDTGLGITPNTTDILTFSFTTSTPNYFFGCIRSSDNNYRWMLNAPSLTNLKGFCKTNATGNLLPSRSASIGTKYTVMLPNVANGVVTINDDAWSTTSNGTVDWSEYTICLFAQHYTNDVIRYGTMNFYCYKRVDSDGNNVAEFVPCYRKSDGVIGAYELVSGTFFTNAGTGTFTKGDDV